MLDFRFTNQFKKDFRLLEKRHYGMDELIDVLAGIICEEPLPERCRPHELSGNYSGFTECHVKNNWLLLCFFCEDGVVFARTGTHSDLF